MNSEDVRLDEMLKRGPVWEPPPGFARRVAMQASPIPETRQRVRYRPLRTLRQFPTNLSTELRLTMEGPVWVVRQYWALLIEIGPQRWRAI